MSPAYNIILGAAFLLFWESDPMETDAIAEAARAAVLGDP